MTEAVIAIPMLPPRSCSPNSRVHWRRRHADVRAFRQCACLAALAWASEAENEWAIRGADVVVMDIEVRWCCRRKSMDTDNLVTACKPARDGVADALFGGQDKHVTIGALTQKRGDGTTTMTLRGEG